MRTESGLRSIKTSVNTFSKQRTMLAVAYLVRKRFLTRKKPIYFAQKCPQNAGNAVSETQISKNFLGGMPPDPLQFCRHYGLPLTKILAKPLDVSVVGF